MLSYAKGQRVCPSIRQEKKWKVIFLRSGLVGMKYIKITWLKYGGNKSPGKIGFFKKKKKRNRPNSMTSEKTKSNKVAWPYPVSLNGAKTKTGLNIMEPSNFNNLKDSKMEWTPPNCKTTEK